MTRLEPEISQLLWRSTSFVDFFVALEHEPFGSSDAESYGFGFIHRQVAELLASDEALLPCSSFKPFHSLRLELKAMPGVVLGSYAHQTTNLNLSFQMTK